MTKEKKKEKEKKGDGEFDNMPERDELDKKAKKYLEKKKDVDDEKDALEVIGDELIDLFVKAGKKKTVIEGSVVELKDIVKKAIKVTKPSHQ